MLIVKQLANWPTGQLANWPTGQLANWPTGQLANWPTGQLANWPTGQPANRPTGQPANRPTGQPANRRGARETLAAILGLLLCLGASLVLPEPAAAQTPGICDRTAAVQSAILRSVPVSQCEQVTRAHLRGMRTLNLIGTAITSLRSGDFAGLGNLRTLSVDNNAALTGLPANVFAGLGNLRTLSLFNNAALTGLPANVFAGLGNLQTLFIHNNAALTGLPANVFAGLGNLRTLSLFNNAALTGLPANVFAGLGNLQTLSIHNNAALTGLPANVFAGLGNLRTLSMRRGTALTSLPSGLLSGLRSLEVLHLPYGVKTLPTGFFSGLRNLRVANSGSGGGFVYGGYRNVPLDVSLERVDSGPLTEGVPVLLRVRIAQGAPVRIPMRWEATALAGQVDASKVVSGSISIEGGDTVSGTFSVTGSSHAGVAPRIRIKLTEGRFGTPLHRGTDESLAWEGLYLRGPSALELKFDRRSVAPHSTLYIAPAKAEEGLNLEFPVQLTSAASADVVVTWATKPGTAGLPDYRTVSAGRLTIPRGQIRGTITVATTEDDTPERHETMSVILTADNVPPEVVLGATEAEGEIGNDDTVVSAGNWKGREGSAINFPVRLSHPVIKRILLTVREQHVETTSSDFSMSSRHINVLSLASYYSMVVGSATRDFLVESDAEETFTLALHSSPRHNRGMTVTVAEGIEGIGTGTIVDGDTATVSVADASSDEGDDTTFTVTLSTRAEMDVAARWRVAPRSTDSATPNDDYPPSQSGTLTIAAGRTEGTFSVKTEEDGIAEGDETFTVELLAPAAGFPNSRVVLGDADATGTIKDDDVAGVSVADASADEGDDVTFTVTLSAAADSDVVLKWRTARGTARGPDYDHKAGGRLTIAAGDTEETFTVGTEEDVIAETDEQFTVKLTAPDGILPANVEFTGDDATGTIKDDDAAPTGVTLSLDKATMAEDVGSGNAREVTVTATVDGMTRFRGPRVVAVSVADSGVANAVDFAAVKDFEITIPAGAVSGSGTFALAPENDNDDEADETVTVSGTMLLPRSKTIDNSVTVTSAQFTLTDDDATPTGVTLSLDKATIAEDVGSGNAREVTVTATVGGSTRFGQERVVVVSVAGSSVANAVDFAAVSDVEITISAGADSGTGTFTLNPTNDAEDEANETVTVSGALRPVGQTSGADRDRSVTVTSAQLTLTDDDGAPSAVALSLDKTTMAENVGTAGNARVVTVRATVGGTTRFAVERRVVVSVAGSGEANAVDFTAVSDIKITISAGANSGTETFTLNPTDDVEDEADETVTVSGKLRPVGQTSGDARDETVAVSSTTLSLTDDDDAPTGVTLNLDKTTMAEDVGTGTAREVTVTATVDGTTRFGQDRVVVVSVAGGGEANAVDFAAVSDIEITISAGAVSGTGTFTLNPTDDDEDEADETVTVSGAMRQFGSSTVDTGVTVTSAQLTLTDDDDTPTDITLSLDKTTMAENVGTGTAREVTVTATVDGTTRFGQDRVVVVSVAGSGAANAVDFAAVNDIEITISAGANSGTGTFTLDPTDDAEDEADETVTVSGALRPVGQTSGDARDGTVTVTSATLSLTDDDATPTGVALSLDKTTMAEDVGTGTAREVTVTATVGGTTRFAVERRVVVSVAGGGAANAVDFAAVSDIEITISAGADSGTGTFTLTPEDDDEDEADETVTVSGELRPVGQTSGDDRDSSVTVTSAQLTLTDDDDTPTGVTLKLDKTTMAENVGTGTAREVTVTATVGGTTRFAVERRVVVSVAGGGAANAVDFAAVSDIEITISAGAASGTGTFTLTPEDDDEDEADETVTVSGELRPVGQTSGDDRDSSVTVTSAQLTLTDDDATPTGVTLKLDKTTMAEDVGTGTAREVTVTATVGGTTRFAVERRVVVSVAGGGAANAVDFAAVSDIEITISAGADSGTGTFTLTPEDDDEDEADETVTVSGELRPVGQTSGDDRDSSVTVTSAQLTLTDDDDTPTGVTLKLDKTTMAENVGTGTAREVTVTATVGGTTRFAVERRVVVSVAGSGVPNAVDFTPVSDIEITISAGANSGTGTFTLDPTDDAEDEADETVTVSGALRPVGQTSGDARDGTVTVTSTTLSLTDDDATPTGVALSLDKTTMAEDVGTGTAREVTVTATVGGTTRFAVERRVVVSVAGGGAANAVDFAAVSDIEITISAGADSGTGTFTLTPEDDDEDEADETVTVSGELRPVGQTSGDDRDSSVTVTSAQLTLTDDDDTPTGVTLKLDKTTMAENVGTGTAREVTVTATVGGTTRFAVERRVVVSVAGGGAANAVDFAAVSDIEITISAGAASGTGTFTLTPEDDDEDEADETVTVSGELRPVGQTSGDDRDSSVTVTSAQLTLTDDDATPTGVTLKLDKTTMAEDVGTGTAREVTVTATVDGTTRFAVERRVVVSVAGGGAANAVDFAAVSDIEITISAGADSGTGTFTLTPEDDDEDEADETVTVSGELRPVGQTSGDDRDSSVTVTSAQLTLTDDDDTPTGVTLKLDKTTMAENVGTGTAREVTVTATVGGTTRFAVERRVVVSVAGSGVPNAVDFTPVSDIEITIPAGAASGTGTFTLNPTDDVEDEADETVTVSGELRPVGQTSGDARDGTVTVTSTTLSLTDDDATPTGVALSLDKTTMAEDVGTGTAREVTVTATVGGTTRFAVERRVVVSVAGGGAANAVDFADVSDVEITISAGANSGTGMFTLTPTNDVEDEADETVTVSGALRPVGQTSGDARDGTVTVTSATLSLTDDDATPTGVALSLDKTTMAENVGTAGNARVVTVTATVGGATRFGQDRVVVVSVAGSGEANAVDFADVSDIEITISAGANSGTGTFTLTPTNDAEDEANETVTVSGALRPVGQTSGADRDRSVTVTSAQLTLTDDDGAPSAVALSLDKTTMAEGVGTGTAREVTVTATVGGTTRFAVERRVVVSVAGSGEANAVDFTAVSDVKITISAGANSGTGTFTLNPTDDVEDEADETVTVSGKLRPVGQTSGDARDETVAVSSTTLSLTDDDDAPTGVTLNLDKTTMAEDVGTGTAREVTVTATVDGTTRFGQDRVVVVSVAGGGEANAVDFAAVSDIEITISAGAVSGTGTFTLNPTDDDEDEADETVTVSGAMRQFGSSTVDTGVTVTSAQLTLTDDDDTPTDITLSLDKTTMAENVGTGTAREVTVTATVDGTTRFGQDRVVVVSVAGSGEANAVDFAAVSDIEITISAGAVSGTGTFTLNPTDDDEDEADETVTVSGAMRQFGSSTVDTGVTVTSAQLTLTDDDATPTGVTLKLDKTTMAENVGTGTAREVTVTATVDGTTRFAVERRVVVSVAGGGEANAVDFAAVNDIEITISAGADSGTGTFTLTPEDDDEDEADETVTVSGELRPVGQTSGDDRDSSVTVTSAQLTLTDDDATPTGVTLKLDKTTMAEDVGTGTAREVTVTATVDGTTRFAVERRVVVSVAGGGAANAVDFAAVSDIEITISAGAASGTGTFTLTPEDDDEDEADETVTVSGELRPVGQTSGDDRDSSVTVTSAQLTLTDDDDTPTGVTLKLDKTTMAENVGTGTAREVTVTATVGGTTRFAVERRVVVSVAGGGVPNAVDFAAVSDIEITISAGAASGTGTFTLNPTDDVEDEADETVTVSGELRPVGQTSGDARDSAVTVTSAQLTLTDDDDTPTGVTLSLDKATMAEDVGTAGNAPVVTVTAAVDGATRFGQDRVVVVSVAGGGEANAVDFAAVSDIEITISAGAASGTGTFTLNPTDDAEDEANETVTVSGELRPVGQTSGDDRDSSVTVTSAQLTLTDDDGAPSAVTLSLDKTTMAEDVGTAGNARVVTVTATVGGATRFAVERRVVVSVAGGGAANAVDFADVSDVEITISAGANSGTGMFTLTPTNDVEDEADETVTVSGALRPVGQTSGDARDGTVTVTSATLSLTDDDATPTGVALSLDKTTMAENVGTAGNARVVTVTATVGGATRFGQDRVVVVSVAGSGEANAVDFADVSDIEITISAGANSGTGTFTLTPTNDAEDEANETVTVSGALRPVGQTSGADRDRSVTVTSAQLTLTDDDGAPSAVALSLDKTTMAEGVGTGTAREVTVTATVGGTTRFAVERRVVVSVAGGGAANAVDFADVSDVEITISAGANSGTGMFTLTPTNDVEDEADETVTVSGALRPVGQTSGDARDGTVTVTSATLSLTDDDATPTGVALSLDKTTMAENVGTAGNARVVTVTATVGGATRFGQDRVVVVSVAGSGEANAVDFADVSDIEITISAGANSGTGTFTLTPTNDAEDEANETVTVSGALRPVGQTSGADRDRSVTVTSAQLTLTDDDGAPSAVALSLDKTTMAEGVGTGTAREVTVTATVGGTTRFAVERRVVVSVAGSGEANAVDFTAVSDVKITISAGANSGTGTFTLNPTDDVEDEADETVTVSGKLRPVGQTSGDARDETVAVSSTTLSLTDDDDAPTGVTLNLDKTTMAEDVGTGTAREVTVTATVDGTTRFGQDRVVVVSVAGGGEANAVDFAAVSDIEITISAGAVSGTGTFTLNPTDDDEDEADETVTVSGAMRQFGSSTVDTGVTVTSAQLTLTDDDDTPTDITLSLDKTTMAENVGTGTAREVTVTATVDGTTRFGQDRVVVVSVAGSGEANAVDFAAVSDIEITISAGAVSGTGTFTLNPTDDDEDEADETVTVSGAMRQFGSSTVDTGVTVTSAQLTLTDDDATPTGVTLKLDKTTMAENVGTGTAREVTVTATVDGTTRFAVERRVVVSVAGGGEANAVDFAAVNDIEITISAGADSGTGTFTLTPEDDDEDEADETVTVSGELRPVGQTSGDDRDSSVTVTSAQLTLTDDDATPTGVTLKLDKTTMAEDVGTGTAREVTVTATVDGTTRFAVERRVVVSVAGGGAANAVDFAAVSDIEITISAGAASGTGTFTLTPEDDDEDEADETVTVSGELRPVGQTSGDDRDSSVTVTSAQLTLTDDDDTPTGVTLKLDKTTMAENVGTGTAREVTVTATVGGTTRFAVERRVVVSVAGGGVPNAVDFAAVSDIEITISAGAASGTGTFTLNPTDDVEDEADETVTVSGELRPVGQTSGDARDSAVTVTSAQLTLTDDDDTPTGVTLSLDKATMAEDVGTAGNAPVVTVTAAVDGATRFGQDRVVVVSVAGGGEANAVDFAAVSDIEITISAGAASGTGTFTLNPTDDAEDEANETVTVSGELRPVGQTSGDDRDSSVTVTSAQLTLTDDDGAPSAVTLSLDKTTMAEDVGTAGNARVVTVTATVGGATRFAVERRVVVSVAGGGAANAVDFADVSDVEITISAGANSGTGMFTLTPTNDVEDEADETVTVSGALRPVGQTSGDARDGTVTVTSATLSLTDDDATPTGVALSLDKTTMAENVGTAGNARVVTVTATVGGATRFGQDRVVVVSVAGSGEANAVDFADVSDIEITISAGANSGTGTFTLTPTNDAEDEANETVTVSGALRPVGQTSGADRDRSVTVTSAQLTLTDDDGAPSAVALSLDKTTMAEGVGTGTAREVTVTATVGGTTRFAVERRVVVSVAGGGAANAVDFADVSDVEITISAGANSGTGMFTLTPTNDVEDEADETVTVSGALRPVGQTSGDARDGTVTVTSATLSLTDDDATPTGVALSLDKTTMAENVGTAGNARVVTVTATVGGATRFGQDRVVVVSVAGSGEANAVDFADVSDIEITISAGAASGTGTFTLNPTDDAEDEANETVTVSGELRPVGQTSGDDRDSSVTVTSAQLTLTDDDGAPSAVTLSLDKTTMAEDVGTAGNARVVTVTATVGGATRFAVERRVVVSVAGSGVANAVDFAAVNDFEITISAGAASGTGTFTLTPQDDNEDEANETVTVSGKLRPVGQTSGADRDETVAVSSTALSLTDDDAPPTAVALSLDKTTMAENVGPGTARVVTVTATVGGATRFAVERRVVVSVAGSGVANAVDFVAVSDFEIIIAAGAASGTGTFTLDPTDDAVDEVHEIVRVSGKMRQVGSSSVDSSVTVTAAQLTLTDDDGAPSAVALSLDKTTMAENVGTAGNARVVTVTATVGGTTRFAVERRVVVSVAGSGVPNAVDFTPVSDIEITIPAGAASGTGTFTLNPTNDIEDEANETVTVTGAVRRVGLTSVDSDITVTPAQLTLTDDDAAEVTGAAAVTVNENKTAAGAYGVTGAPPTVVWSLDGVDAAAFEIDGNGALAFRAAPDFEAPTDAGKNNIYDVAVEAATGGGRALASLAVAVTVADVAEPPPAPEEPTVTGASNVSLAATWTAPVVPDGTPPITRYRLRYREAGAAGSWNSHSQADTSTAAAIAGLAPGTSYEVQVMAFNHEGDSGWSPSGAGATGRAVSIAIADGRAREGREVVFTVTLSSTAGIDVVLDWRTADGTAQVSDDTAIPDDYTEADGTLTILDGGTSGTIAVQTVEDGMAEADETFLVVLSAPAAGLPDGVVLTDAEAVGTIEDDDAAPARIVLSATDAQGDVMTEIPEGGGETAVTVKATVEGGSTFPEARFVRVRVEGSGTGGVVGFAASPNAFDIEIPAGHVSASRNFDLAPEDDDVDETDETVEISGEMVPRGERRSGRAAAPPVIPVIPARLTIVDDDAFTVSGPRSVEVDEGETRVASYRVAGAPGGAAVTWSLAGTDTKAFEIGDNGALAFPNAPDFEDPTDNDEDNVYRVMVSATDAKGRTVTVAVTVEVTDVNEQPAFDEDAYTFELAENRDGREEPVALGAVSATDPDAGDTLAYAITRGDKDLFAIDGASGLISYTGPGEDYESEPNVYELTVTAADGEGLSATAADGEGLSATAVVTVEVIDVNEAPVFDRESYPFELAENRDGREEPVALGAVSATDPDAGDTLAYAITRGDKDLFAIDGASGLISYTGPGEDYESEPNVYELTVTAADGEGLSATAVVTVEVIDVNEPPVFDQESYPFELEENRIGPVELAAVRATDPDGDTVSYAITGGDMGLFSIDGASGLISYTGPGEDYESEPNVYELIVTATDGEGLSGEAGVTVTITDEKDAIARARLQRVNEAILPELSRAMVSGVVEDVARRIEDANPHTPAARGSYTVAGYPSIEEALLANEEALNDGTMDWKRALAGSSFAFGLGRGDSSLGKVTLWGEGDWRELAAGGEEDPVEFDGGVLGARLGLDARLGRRLLAGLALSWSQSAFDYTDQGEAGYLPVGGTHEGRMTSLHPYAGWWPTERLGLWGTVGYGWGDVEIDDDEAGVQSSDGTLMAAVVGGHARLFFSDDGPIEGGATMLNLKGEAWAARFDLDDSGGLMRGQEVDVHRLRLGLEGEHARGFADGTVLTPSLELGLRHDGGDGETGWGVELGGGLAWTDPARGLTADVHGRALLAHQGDIKEWGVGGLMTFAPGADGLGLSLSLRPSWGETGDGLARLWEDGLAAANDPLAGGADTAMQLDTEIGYGLSTIGGHGVLTPYGGLTLFGSGRTWRLGGRLRIAPALHLSLEWELQETDAAPTEHAVMLTFRLGLGQPADPAFRDEIDDWESPYRTGWGRRREGWRARRSGALPVDRVTRDAPPGAFPRAENRPDTSVSPPR